MGITLPHNPEAERAVLAAMIMDEEAAYTALEILEPDDFYLAGNEAIFKAIQSLLLEGKPVDYIGIVDELRREGDLDRAGGIDGIITLTQAVATSTLIDYHAGLVLDASKTRRLIKICWSTAETGSKSEAPPDQLIGQVESELFAIQEKRVRGIGLVSEYLSDAIKNLDTSRKDYVPGVQYGFPDLDLKTGGFHRGEVTILAARPSMGKSSLAIAITRKLAIEQREPVAFVSLEVSAEGLIRQILSPIAKVSMTAIRRKKIEPDEMKRLVDAASVIYQAPLYINDDPLASVFSIRSWVGRVVKHVNLKLVVVDYLQLIHSNLKTLSREQEVSFISRSFKGIARSFDVPVLVLCQMSRKIEYRGEQAAPRLSDLRESGSIEQDADVVLFIHSSKSKLENPTERVSLIIEKQRQGPKATIDLIFNAEYAEFKPAAPEYYEKEQKYYESRSEAREIESTPF